MKPAVGLVLGSMVDDMNRQLAFVPPGSERLMMAGMKVMLGVLARHADDAAALRLAEIGALTALLRQAAPACPPALAARLHASAARAGAARDDIRISALERVLDPLRDALIALQTELESSPRAEAAALLGQTWAFLAQANARRTVADKPW